MHPVPPKYEPCRQPRRLDSSSDFNKDLQAAQLDSTLRDRPSNEPRGGARLGPHKISVTYSHPNFRRRSASIEINLNNHRFHSNRHGHDMGSADQGGRATMLSLSTSTMHPLILLILRGHRTSEGTLRLGLQGLRRFKSCASIHQTRNLRSGAKLHFALSSRELLLALRR